MDVVQTPLQVPVHTSGMSNQRRNIREPDRPLLDLAEVVRHLQQELKQQKDDQQALWRHLHRITQSVGDQLNEFKSDLTLRACAKSVGQSPESDLCSAKPAQCYADSKSDGFASSSAPSCDKHNSVAPATQQTLVLGAGELANIIEDTRSFENSVWEVAAVTGTKCLRPTTSMLLWFIMLLTSFVQLTYIFAGHQVFGTDPFSNDRIQGLDRWRTEVGHSIAFADPLGTPLVQNICNGTTSIATGTLQLSKIAVIKAYFDGWVHVGVVLCLLALLLWYLSIWTSCQSIVDFAMGLMCLKTGYRQRFVLLLQGDLQFPPSVAAG